MAPSTLSLPSLGSGSTQTGRLPALAVAPTRSTGFSIRMAGLSDIPAIARITQEGPQPDGIEPEVMSRATRLLLTHVAFEHGALWVEKVDDGPIIRAVTAIPAGELPLRRAVLAYVTRGLGRASAAAPVAGFSQDLLDELAALDSSWLLIEISKASQNQLGDPALLGTALSWARAQTGPAQDPVMVLTDTVPERSAAQQLGFVERRIGGRRWPWWLGVHPG